jgi:ABC-type sugar transport system substrate-binding protein
LLVFVVFPGVKTAESGQDGVPDDYDTPVDQIDEETLAGLSGEGAALDAGRETGELKIGVTLQEVSGRHGGLLTGLESAAALDVRNGAIDDFEVRDARGSRNQQIQDVYSMINKGFSVIIVVGADEYNFGKISEICANNNVQLVAYGVDAESGFAVNVVDRSDASADFARFIKNSGLDSTNVLKGTEEQLAAVEA